MPSRDEGRQPRRTGRMWHRPRGRPMSGSPPHAAEFATDASTSVQDEDHSRGSADDGEPARLTRRILKLVERSVAQRRPRPWQRDHDLRRRRPTTPRPSGSSPSCSELIEKGETLTADAVRRTVGMLEQGTHRAPGRGAHAQHPVPPRPHDPPEDAGPEDATSTRSTSTPSCSASAPPAPARRTWPWRRRSRRCRPSRSTGSS